jgi:hypothetical protein
MTAWLQKYLTELWKIRSINEGLVTKVFDTTLED